MQLCFISTSTLYFRESINQYMHCEAPIIITVMNLLLWPMTKAKTWVDKKLNRAVSEEHEVLCLWRLLFKDECANDATTTWKIMLLFWNCLNVNPHFLCTLTLVVEAWKEFILVKINYCFSYLVAISSLRSLPHWRFGKTTNKYNMRFVWNPTRTNCNKIDRFFFRLSLR